MRRRRPPEAEGRAPSHLTRYNPADWPKPHCHPECAFWEAVEQWHDEHPADPTAALEIIDGPDVPWHPEWL